MLLSLKTETCSDHKMMLCFIHYILYSNLILILQFYGVPYKDSYCIALQNSLCGKVALVLTIKTPTFKNSVINQVFCNDGNVI